MVGATSSEGKVFITGQAEVRTKTRPLHIPCSAYYAGGSVINKNSDWGRTCLPETALCLRVAIFLTIFVVFSFAGICDKNDDGAAL